MKCSACHIYVHKIPVSWKCPHCGEKLPELSKWFIMYEDLVAHLLEKGALFWGIWFGIFIIALGLAELPFGTAHLLSYIGKNLFMALIGIFFGGMLMDMVMKVNLPLRLPYGSDFVLRERAAIRNIRKITNLALLVGVIFSFFWMGPQVFITYFPAYVLVVGWFLALVWSVIGLFIDPRLLEDVRFRSFLDRLGITSLRRYRKLGTVFIGLLIVIAIGFNVLLGTRGLWNKVENLYVVGTLIRFSKAYLGWLF